MREESRKPRSVTVQLEIIQDYYPFGQIKLVIDGNYQSTAYLDPKMYNMGHSGNRLYDVLIAILDKYHPRATIEGTIEKAEPSDQ